jgi:hypothetical protein
MPARLLPWSPIAWTTATAILSAVSIVICIRAFAPLGTGVMLFLIVGAFALPGVLTAWLAFTAGPGRALAAWTIGPIWGYGLSSVVLLALWMSGLRGSILLVAPLVASLAAAALGMLLNGRIRPKPGRRSDPVALFLLIALVPLLVGRPFARVGEAVPEGKAYRAYFTADMVWRMAVVAELSKGDFPPRNPFFRGDQLHYYWLAHLLPAAEYRALYKRVTIEQLLLMFFFGFARQWIDSPPAAVVACAVALLGSSFEGLERLIFLWRNNAPLDLVDTLNIDAVTRWFYDSLPVDGLHRLLWYQPHHSTGYAIGLSAVFLAAQADDALSARVMLVCGTLLGLCLLLSSFSGIMLTAIVAAVALNRVVMKREWRRMPNAALAAAVPLAAATLLAFSLRYVDRSGASLLRVLVNPAAIHNTVPALVLSFGPLLAGAAAGALLAVKRRERHILTLGLIVAVSFLFYFFVDLRDHQYVYVGWRAGHLLFISFAVLSGYALQELARKSPTMRSTMVVTGLLLTVLAIPTFAIDYYNTQDISNRKQASGFKWTLVLSHDEIAMFDWIKQYTNKNAIVQVEPFARHSETWAYVPAFAERRMAAGLPISMVPLDKYQAASEQIRYLYRDHDPEVAYQRAARLGIDYLIVGQPERREYPHFEDMLRSNPARFRQVFRRKEVSVYFVETGR